VFEQVQRIRAIPAKRSESRLVNHLNREEMQSLRYSLAPWPTLTTFTPRRCGI
jgi:hypothetical protein